MQNLFRRPSGVYFIRLVVPVRLRGVVGKRELVQTTGTRDLVIAKMVATGQLGLWRQRFFELDRLALNHGSMDFESILKIESGHPSLTQPGYLPLPLAAAASGIDQNGLLRHAADGRLGLFCRLAGVRGFLLPFCDLEPDEVPTVGTRIIPSPAFMPNSAWRFIASAVLAIERGDVAQVVDELLAGESSVESMLFEHEGRAFVPDEVVHVKRESIELRAQEVDGLRRNMAATIRPEDLDAAKRARESAATTAAAALATGGPRKHAGKRLSDAIEAYVKNFLPKHIRDPKAIRQQRQELELLVEFEGDVLLTEFDTERLRDFRDGKLSTMLARENHARAKFGSKSMTESIAAAAGGWELMSVGERDVRMQRISRMFRWLHDQKWIADNPATGLRGESVASKAERSVASVGKREREPFNADQLRQIFSVEWFTKGKGTLTKANTYREFQPFQYWLPLLGLFTGCRVGEASQLWLEDVRQTDAGTWYVDINKYTPDKQLKTDWSARKVPLHPVLLDAGLIEWCVALRGAGYKRLFPELSWFEVAEYSKEAVRKHSELFARLGMPRNNTKVFHSFRHTLNNALERMPDVKDVARKRIMGHLPGESVNERTYLDDRSPDEALVFMQHLDFTLPPISRFDAAEGLKAVRDALMRKTGRRRGMEDMGPAR